MSFFGVQLNAQLNSLFLEIRLRLSQNKFSPNFRTIYRSFAKKDPQISGKISAVNFENVLNQNGIFLKKYQVQVFEKAYSENKQINWFNFMEHLREPMGPVRSELVEQIFDGIDTQKKGKLTTDQLSMSHLYLVQKFDPSEIQAYKKQLKSAEQLQSQILSLLSSPDGFVTRQQFIAFYDDCNINFTSNESFRRYVSNQWKHTAQQVIQAKEQQIKNASRELRTKLLQKSQGTKDEYLISKLFIQFDLNHNQTIGPYELGQILKNLQIKALPRVVDPLLSVIDRKKSGFIEYQDFKNYLLNDPFPL